MDKPQDSVVRIDLTEEQKEKIRSVTGKELDAVEFSVNALEDRIAPARALPKL